MVKLSKYHVQPPLKFIPPNFNPGVLRISRWRLPWLLRIQSKIADIQVQNIEPLVKLYQQFQQGQARFLVAFRHPHSQDPFCLSYLFWNSIPKAAKTQRISLTYPTHFHFIYDRGIPLWAGEKQGELYSQLGGTPIHRGKADKTGLKSARRLFLEGKFPLAAAPEGATNGLSERVSPLEPGVATLGFWAVEDLKKQNRNEEVFIVPLGIQYYYCQENWQALAKILTQLEQDCGISEVAGKSPSDRLCTLASFLLTHLENYYQKFYHQQPPNCQDLTTRFQTLLENILQVAEKFYHLTPQGTKIDRCRRLEQAGWNWIYREDIPNLSKLSPLDFALADRIAAQSQEYLGHMRLVETFVALTPDYLTDNPNFERQAEITLLLHDALTRIQGKNPFNRPNLGQQSVKLNLSEPLSITQRWQQGNYNHSAPKTAVIELTQDLQTCLETLITPQNPQF